MTDVSMLWAPGIVAEYDFGKWGSLMDIGRGNGLLLATIMRTHPALRGVLSDQGQVLDRPDERVRFEPVDFFNAIPSGCRAYVMKNVIHDWDDERARRILLNCRRAVPDDGVLLLVEYSLGEENSPTIGKTVDVVMLTITGGRERTVREHRELLASAGFWMNQMIPLSNDAMISRRNLRLMDLACAFRRECGIDGREGKMHGGPGNGRGVKAHGATTGLVRADSYAEQRAAGAADCANTGIHP